MRILFLDDMKERHDLFSQLNIGKGHEVWYTWNVEQAIKRVEEQAPFDLMFLDHDLADEHYPGYTGERTDREATGKDFVRWLVHQTSKWPKAVVVHSWNPDGRKEMAAILSDAEIPVTLDMFGKGLVRYL